MSNNRTAIIGDIIKHNKGIGFKLTFQSKQKAQYYKDMIMFILKDDNYQLKDEKEYYEKKQVD